LAYSDAGLTLAGAVAESVTGTPYERLLQHRLLEPLGMSDTSFWPNVSRLTSPYRQDGMRLVPAPIEELTYPLDDRATRYPAPGGGLFSTAADVGKFCRMLLRAGEVDGRRYLSHSAIEAMSTPHIDPMSNETSPLAYGLGWSAGENGSFGHGGMYGSSMRIFPVEGVATAWLQQALTTADECVSEF
jgi:CubicO group peptidase (beta-lactamase class C family)